MKARDYAAEQRSRERLQGLNAIDKAIAAFNRKCAEDEHTDTGEAWDLFYWIQRKSRDLQKLK